MARSSPRYWQRSTCIRTSLSGGQATRISPSALHESPAMRPSRPSFRAAEMIHITRRHLLRLSAASGAAAVLPGIGGLAFATDGTPARILVIVHLRGGCDALNLVSPSDDPNFVAARSPELRVLADGSD